MRESPDPEFMAKTPSSRPPLLVVIGPTAVGKTTLSLRLADLFNGEIVSADSRLFYKGLDIGTDKPGVAERSRIPHHLIDICEPDQTVSLGEYFSLANTAIANIHARKRLPLLVGGTGQYVRAVVEGWGIPAVAPNQPLRVALEALGGDELGRWLEELDPTAAGRINTRNVRRVIRALEVTLVTGRPISSLQQKNPPLLNINIIGLTCERQLLYNRIDARVDRMISEGLIEEIMTLKDAGYGPDLPSMSGLGYRQIYNYVEGKVSIEEAIARIKFETHRFVRQQYTWFNLADSNIEWFDVMDDDFEAEVGRQVEHWLLEMGSPN